MKKSIILASILAISSFGVSAAEIKFVCYQDANECDVLRRYVFCLGSLLLETQ